MEIGKIEKLTKTELQALTKLIQNEGEAVDNTEIMPMTAKRLRGKIGKDVVARTRGGYRLAVINGLSVNLDSGQVSRIFPNQLEEA